MANIVTDNDKERILKNNRADLQKEIKSLQKEIGIRGFIPRNGQDEYRQIGDLKAEKNHIIEQQQEAHEKSVKRRKEIAESKKKSYSENLRLYLARIEKGNREDFEKKKIHFDEGFEELENTVKMLPCRVLLKEIRETSEKGIDFVDTHYERNPKFKVISFGEGVEGINPGDIVMVDPYSGLCIETEGNRYRIVFDESIMCVCE